MKILKKLSCSALSGLMLLQMLPVLANAGTESQFKYTLKADGTAKVSCTDTEIEIAEIPSEIDGHKITSLEQNCFYNCEKLKEVHIPETVTEIGSYAFYNCLSLEEMQIPASVTTIESYAFEATPNIIQFSVEENNPAYQSPDGVLYNKSGYTLIKYPESKADTSYKIPDTCQEIADWAFIGAQYLEQIDLNHVQHIGEDAFCWCVGLKSVTIPEGVETLEGAVFSYCENLEQVTLPASVEAIGNRCFYSCTNLKKVNLSEGLTKIGEYAFCHCTSLKELAVPKSMVSVNIDCMGYYYDEEKEDYLLQEGFKLYVYRNSAAWKYAATNHIEYEYIQTGLIYYILISIVLIIIIALLIAIVRTIRNRRAEA